ncbi:hypothetical protein V8D89_005591, partial [Ganoderma adspersum]
MISQHSTGSMRVMMNLKVNWTFQLAAGSSSDGSHGCYRCASSKVLTNIFLPLRYQAWFYVNTLENPPRSSWVHPLGAAPPEGYGPPAGPPPPNQYNNPYPPPGGYNQSPPPQQQWGQSPPPPSGGYYGSPPPPQGGYPGQYGGPPPGQDSRGWFGSNTPQPQQQPVYAEQRPPKKSGPGMGTALLAGGAGLVGGALLMDAFENHEDHEREEAYDSG